MRKSFGCGTFLFVAFLVFLIVPANWLSPSPPVDPAKPATVYKYHIYKFSAKWCPGCRMQQAAWLLASADAELTKQGIKSFDLDIDKYKTLANAWKVKSLPTTIIVEVGSSGTDAVAIRRHDGPLTGTQIKDFVNLQQSWPNK